MSREQLVQRISKIVKCERENREWTQAELGKHADISGAAISQIEAGDRLPSLIVIIGLANAFGCSLGAFINDKITDDNQLAIEKSFFYEWGEIKDLCQSDRRAIKAIIEGFVR